MRAQGIEVAGVELEPSAWHQKRSRDPTRRKAYDAVTRRQRLEYEIAIGHRKSQCPLALGLSSQWTVKLLDGQAQARPFLVPFQRFRNRIRALHQHPVLRLQLALGRQPAVRRGIEQTAALDH